MRLKLTFFSCLCLGLFFSCNNKVYTLSELPDKQIIFGSGGGFTGAYTQYLLLENGQLFFTTNHGKTYDVIENMNKKTAKDFFKEVETLMKSKKIKNQPGNMTYFVHYKTGETTTKIIWGQNGPQIDDDIDSFYNALNKSVKGKKPKTVGGEKM